MCESYFSFETAKKLAFTTLILRVFTTGRRGEKGASGSINHMLMNMCTYDVCLRKRLFMKCAALLILNGFGFPSNY